MLECICYGLTLILKNLPEKQKAFWPKINNISINNFDEYILNIKLSANQFILENRKLIDEPLTRKWLSKFKFPIKYYFKYPNYPFKMSGTDFLKNYFPNEKTFYIALLDQNYAGYIDESDLIAPEQKGRLFYHAIMPLKFSFNEPNAIIIHDPRYRNEPEKKEFLERVIKYWDPMKFRYFELSIIYKKGKIKKNKRLLDYTEST